MLLPLLEKRRSIRKFENRPVEPEKVDALVEAMLRAPSSRGKQPWEFVVVTDPGLLGKMAAAKEHGSSFLEGAPLAVVVCADPEKCDVWVEDCSISAIILQLAATSLGLGSCWSQIRKRMHGDGRSAEEYLIELLGLPSHYRVETVVGIGYPAVEPAGHAKSKLPYSKVHYGRYGAGRS